MSDRKERTRKKKTNGEAAPFVDHVLKVVRAIPRGRVLTYGQVALLVGTPRGARQVGWALYFHGRQAPWQRVINHYGGISTYKVGTGELQRQLLEEEGIEFRSDGTIDLKEYQWVPNRRTFEKLSLTPQVAFNINAKLPYTS